MKTVVALALALISLPALAADPRPFIRGSWQEIRQEHSGRPVVVHFWGVTCGPCLAELPKWGEWLSQKPGLEIVMIAADPVVDDARALAAVLSKAGCSAAESWMFADPFTERLAYEVDPQWGGELPYTLLVAGDGSASAILGMANFSEIDKWAKNQADRKSRD